MSLSDLFVKGIGVILALGGLALVFASLGAPILWGFVFSPAWLGVIIGLLLIGIGVYIIRGGNITP